MKEFFKKIKSFFTKLFKKEKVDPSKLPIRVLICGKNHKLAEGFFKNNKYKLYKKVKGQDVVVGHYDTESLTYKDHEYKLEDIGHDRFKATRVDEKGKVQTLELISYQDYEMTKRIIDAKIGGTIGKVFIYIFLILLAIAVLFPFYWMVNTSLKTYEEFSLSVPTYWPHQVMWSNYATAFTQAKLGHLFINTVYVGVVSTLLSLVITILAAFAFSRLEFPGRDTMFSMMLGTMMIPGEMFTITNYATVYSVDSWFRTKFAAAVKAGDNTGGIWGRLKKSRIDLDNITPFKNWLMNMNINTHAIWADVMNGSKEVYESITFSNTYAALIIPFLVSIYYIYLLRQNFKQIPNELYLAAKVDGTSDFGYLLKVMLPLSAPTIVTITILKMMGAWNSYVWPRLVANSEGMKLITNGIRSASFTTVTNQTDYPLQMAAVVIVTVPLFLVFLLFRKYIMRGVSKSGTKG